MILTCATVSGLNWQSAVDFDLRNELAIFRVQVSANKLFIPALSPVLSAAELLRARKFHQLVDHDRFIVARAALRILLGKYSGQSPANLNFASDSTKKPFLVGASKLHFNVSHSNDWILLAIAAMEVGIDVEKVDSQLAFEDILPHTFSLSEQEIIGSSRASRQLFFQSWTRKEAFVKATGQGIDADFQQVPSLDGRHQLLQEEEGDPSEWLLTSFEVATDYVAAIAYKRALYPALLKFHLVTGNQLRAYLAE